MTQSKTKNFKLTALFLIAGFIFSFLSGCSSKWTKIEKLDTDLDGSIDMIRYYEGEFLNRQDLLHYKDNTYKGEITVWRSINEVDYIEMIPNEVFISGLDDKATREAYKKTLRKFFKQGFDIVINGENLHIQEVDKIKSFGNLKVLGNTFLIVKDQKKYASKVTTKNGLIMNLVFYDSDGAMSKIYEDNNQDGFFDVVIIYRKNQTPNRAPIRLATNTPITVLRTHNI